jgi:poly-gamma-glutamate capsule biosynthesis protein CapA/YwtB (metallophosphatase superfamily)
MQESQSTVRRLLERGDPVVSEKGRVTITAVGDVRVFRDEPETLFEHVRSTFQQADIAFCQSEGVYSEKGSEGSSGMRGAAPNDPRCYPAFAGAGFNVVSMASNHTMDWGRDALLDTLDRMRSDGMYPIGAGADLDEARKPAVIEKHGVKVAFLGYCSVAPKSYYAVPGRAGVAPMRAITHYEPLEEDQPGTPCEIMSWPVERDLEELVRDVESVRESADIVIVSLHWGVHWIPGLIADYQPPIAHAAVDAGADAVIGHHAHLLKGVEFYQGSPIFYGLGNFAHDSNSATRPTDQAWRQKLKDAYRLYGTPGPHDYRKLEEAKYSMIAELTIESGAISRVSFTPVVIDDNKAPRPVLTTEENGRAIATYVEEISREAGFDTKVRIEGGRAVLEDGISG